MKKKSKIERANVYAKGNRQTLNQAIEKYKRLFSISVVKRGHLDW